MENNFDRIGTRILLIWFLKANNIPTFIDKNADIGILFFPI